MPKPAVVYTLTAAAFLLFSFSRTLHVGPRHGARQRLHHHVAFDPLVDELKLQVEERGLLDVQAYREKLDKEFHMLECYFGEEGWLNTTERLMHFFPLLDQSPKDRVISFKELEVWNRRQALDRLMYSTERTMRVHGKDGDGAVTLQEFLFYIPDEEKDWKNMEHGRAGWWKEQFVNADTDSNGTLKETEFSVFLHPEDSSNPKIQMWLQKEKMRFLSAEELKPIVHLLHPGELSHAMYYTKYLMHEADDDEDGKLTLKEMLNHHHAFYNAVVKEGRENEDDDDNYHHDIHDELR